MNTHRDVGHEIGGEVEKASGWRGSREVWLAAARQALIESGLDAVKIQPLASGLGIARTSFYWFFRDRTELLEALVADWEARNTGAFVEACDAFAETITEGLLNLIAVFHDETVFDPRRRLRRDLLRPSANPQRDGPLPGKGPIQARRIRRIRSRHQLVSRVGR